MGVNPMPQTLNLGWFIVDDVEDLTPFMFGSKFLTHPYVWVYRNRLS
jgi:hypothetical protein